jgi:hypothetical protein
VVADKERHVQRRSRSSPSPPGPSHAETPLYPRVARSIGVGFVGAIVTADRTRVKGSLGNKRPSSSHPVRKMWPVSREDKGVCSREAAALHYGPSKIGTVVGQNCAQLRSVRRLEDQCR